MKTWFRASVVFFAVALVVLTACSRERSGDVRDGEAGSDAVEVLVQDDEFAPDVLSLRPERR